MPNEFEKIVQQKMDELKLVPSEPVWQKVEMQIRKKKDRRRLIFWITFLVLLLGSGVWMGVDHYSSPVTYNDSNNVSQKKIISSEVRQTTSQNITTKEKANKRNIDKNIQKSSEEVDNKLQADKPGDKNETGLTNEVYDRLNKEVKRNVRIISQTVGKLSSQKIEPLKENLIVREEQVQAENDDTVLTRKKVSEIIITQPLEKINRVVPGLDVMRTIDTAKSLSVPEIQIKPAIAITDSTKSDSASKKQTEIKKYAESKWKYNLVAASGLSGLSNLSFFNVFSGEKSMDALNASSPGTSQTPGTAYYRPSAVRKGLSFSFGAEIEKQLSMRLRFSFGLQYNYYSNSILVGSRIRRDTVFRYAYPVSQYFANNSNAFSYSAVPERYHNHYHFISLPLTINWQLSKKLPLNFYTGISIQQMIQTNALVFDYNAQAYYHNNKAFNRTLVFTEYGLNYSIPLSKRYLSVGPEFHYGLSSLEKNNPDHHLFSYGLKAQLQLEKK